MAEAVRERSFNDAADAYIDLLDCDIDLVHCIFYAQHHDYDCSE